MYNSSYSFMHIILKLHMCFGHCFKMCMWFGYNPQIILSFFPQFELCHFSGVITIKVCRQWVPCEGNSPYMFTFFEIVPLIFNSSKFSCLLCSLCFEQIIAI